MKKLRVFVLASLAFVASEAPAQNTRLIGEVGRNRSASAVARLLEQAGCDRLYVSQALEDSKNVLSRGRVILKADSCEKAPTEVARRSQLLLSPRVARKVAPPLAPKPVESLAPKVAELEKEVASLKASNAELTKARATLEKEKGDALTTLSHRTQELENLKKIPVMDDGERTRIAVNYSVGGAFLTALVFGLGWLLLNRRSSNAQEQKIEVKDHSETA